jgi:hypothetical protein
MSQGWGNLTADQRWRGDTLLAPFLLCGAFFWKKEKGKEPEDKVQRSLKGKTPLDRFCDSSDGRFLPKNPQEVVATHPVLQNRWQTNKRPSLRSCASGI